MAANKEVEKSAASEEVQKSKKNDKKDERPAKKTKETSSTTYRNGLSCTDLVTGSGKKAESGKQIAILYTGTLENGKVGLHHSLDPSFL
jgi:FKBP-type peptidyl-prolyl cis-trans isomerase